jgi:hypothetical protein
MDFITVIEIDKRQPRHRFFEAEATRALTSLEDEKVRLVRRDLDQVFICRLIIYQLTILATKLFVVHRTHWAVSIISTSFVKQVSYLGCVSSRTNVPS